MSAVSIAISRRSAVRRPFGAKAFLCVNGRAAASRVEGVPAGFAGLTAHVYVFHPPGVKTDQPRKSSQFALADCA
jgi:hypothetical protein